MSSLALRRGPGAAFAELPPTLQPRAITSSAPHPDRLISLGLAGLIYLLIGTGVLVLSVVTPRVMPPPVRHTEPTRIVEIGAFPRPLIRSVAGTAAASQGVAQPTVLAAAIPIPIPDPDQPATGLSTEDRSHRMPAGFPVVGSVPSSGSPAAGSQTGPLIQDFGWAGLTVLKQVNPIYPDFARKAHIQGSVVLLMTVNELGVPIAAEILEGHAVFHETALQAARQWRFEPAKVDGRPVIAVFRLTLKFTLR